MMSHAPKLVLSGFRYISHVIDAGYDVSTVKDWMLGCTASHHDHEQNEKSECPWCGRHHGFLLDPVLKIEVVLTATWMLSLFPAT
jgi:hypothetical protein